MLSQIKRYQNAIVLSVIFLIGVFLRFYQIDFNSLWFDELFTWEKSSYKAFSDVLFYGVWKDTHPPVHISLMYLVQNIFGDSEIALRAPSAIAGSATILVTYFLGRDLYRNSIGLFASSLVACSYFLIYHSQIARVYALLGFFVLVATWTFYCLITTEKQLKRKKSFFRLTYIISAIFCIYCHHFGMIFIGGQIAYTLLNSKLRVNILNRELFTFLSIAILSIPAVFLIIHHLTSTMHRTDWIPPLTLQFFYGLFKDMMGDSKAISLATVVIILISISTSVKRGVSSLSFSTRYLLFCLLFVFAVTTVFSITVKPMMMPRYFLFLAPIVYILITQCFFCLSSNKKIGSFIVTILSVAMFYALIYSEKYYIEHSLPDKKSVSLLIRDYINTSASDQCMIYAHRFSNRFVSRYYFEKYDVNLTPRLVMSARESDKNLDIKSEQISEIINDKTCETLLIFYDRIGNNSTLQFNNITDLIVKSGDVTLINHYRFHKSSLMVYQVSVHSFKQDLDGDTNANY